MKILISQREILLTNSVGDTLTFDGIERSWYKLLKHHIIIPVPNTVIIDTKIDFDCLIISGGPDSVARHLTENALFTQAVRCNKPVIGICHGAFAINDLTGGINGTITGHAGSVHDIIMDGSTYQVNSYHNQSIAKLGENMLATAHDLDGNIEAFKHTHLNVHGIVWHPERMDNCVLPKDVAQLLV